MDNMPYENYQIIVVMVCSFVSTFWICCKVAPSFTTKGFESLETLGKHENTLICHMYLEIVLNCVIISATHTKDWPAALLIIGE